MVTMAEKRSYDLIYDRAVRDHLRSVEAMHYTLIRKTIESQLRHEPDVETRNRKPLKRPVAFEATWELRFGPQNRFRVFYDVNRKDREVDILAFGVKLGNRLTIGGKEIEI